MVFGRGYLLASCCDMRLAGRGFCRVARSKLQRSQAAWMVTAIVRSSSRENEQCSWEKMNNVPILQQPSFACPDLLVQGIGSLAGLGLGEHSILSSLLIFDPLTSIYFSKLHIFNFIVLDGRR